MISPSSRLSSASNPRSRDASRERVRAFLSSGRISRILSFPKEVDRSPMPERRPSTEDRRGGRLAEDHLDLQACLQA